jgi:hypothetical protein
LLFKLLIAVLQFLDRAGQRTDRAFQPLDARHKFGRVLRRRRHSPKRGRNNNDKYGRGTDHRRAQLRWNSGAYHNLPCVQIVTAGDAGVLIMAPNIYLFF